MYGRVALPCCIATLHSFSSIAAADDRIHSAVVPPPRLPSVLPERGGLQVVGVGLQHASVVTAEVLAVGGVADGQLVVVAELEEEVDGRVAAAHHRLLVTHHPVFACRVCGVRRRGSEGGGIGDGGGGRV